MGSGDSAAQVANELAAVATTSIATRHPIQFIPQHIGGHDVHYWLRETGFDTLPAPWLSKITDGAVVTDSVGFRQTLAEGLVDQRPMFVALDGDRVVWSDGDSEPVDAIILATGYRPSLGYLRELGALDDAWRSVARGRYLDDPPRTRLRGIGVPALVCLEHPEGSQRRRESRDRPTGRLDPRRAHEDRTRTVTPCRGWTPRPAPQGAGSMEWVGNS